MIKMILRVYYLFFFAREALSVELNRTITVCENEPAKLSCVNNSNIKITSVEVGPLKEPYRIETGNIDLLILGDDNATQTQQQFEGICNEKQSCLVNETSINFSQYQIPRTIDVSYRCEYEYVGCYIDDRSRAFRFQPRNPHYEMSTQICYQFCLKQNQFVRFFATENGNECYCGNGEKLGNGAYKAASGCNKACKNNQNRDEMCGGNWRLSVYDMNTGKQTVNGVLTKNKIAVKCSHHAGAKDINVKFQHSSGTCKYNTTTTNRRLSLSTNEVYTGRDYCYLLENSVEFGDDKSCYEPIFATLNYSCVENHATAIRDDTRNKDEQNGTGLIIGAIGGLSTIVIAALLLLALRLHIGNRENQTKSSPVKPSSEELASYTDLQSQTGSSPYSILNTSTQQADINKPNVRETSKGSSTSNDYEDMQYQSKNEHYENNHHMQRTESDHEYSDLYDKNEIV